MNFRSWVSGAALVALTASVAQAQTIVKDNSTPVSVASVTNYVTNFDDIVGMQVNWTLSSGSYSGIWDVLGGSAPAGSYGIWTTDFKLWSTGSYDTYDMKWNLWAVDLVSFSLLALPGNAVFDVIPTSPTGSTPGSSNGQVFDWSPNLYGTTVTYSNPIGVDPNAPVLDLYGMLNVTFGQTSSESCLSGWTLYNHQCKQVATTSCASGYTYQSSGTYAGECTKYHNTTCPSGWTLQNSGAHSGECKKNGQSQYQAPTINYYTQNPTYTYNYQAPIVTYQPVLFGTSSKCDDTKAYNYSHSSTDNTKCFAQFYQDMDNVAMLDDPGTPQDVVPEPMTMTLLATGLVGMSAARRRRRNK